ncbi:MAG: hypothetical protein HY517_02900 [Candidatus Aenigmarchaeota archaeon]|nr:hypothetical protein [Candidatus Aenigmarchaeota archaeon]
MKGQLPISELLMTAMSILFLLMGLVLLITIIFTKINPYDQIAFANVERLRASMDEACFAGQSQTSFELPQLSPKFSSVLPIMPIWIIQSNGDPNYVLYYEAFAPGDATGWEVYHSMQNRMVAPYIGNDGDNAGNVRTYAENLQAIWKTKVTDNPDINTDQFESKELGAVIINNIMLNGNRPDYFSDEAGTNSPSQTNYGEWKSVKEQGAENPVPVEGDNVFLFNNYKALTSIGKTSIKYAPCGDNALCMKTRSGIYRYPLRQCNDLKYVELVYDSRDKRRYIFEAAGVAIVAAAAIPAGTIAVGSTLTPAMASSATVIGETALGEAMMTAGGVTFIASPGAGGLAVTEIIGSTGAGAGTILSSAAGWFGRGLVSASRFAVGKSWKLFKGVWKWCKICAIGGALYSGEKIGEFLGGVFLSSKVQDFNIESPCTIKEMKIKRIDCSKIKCTDTAKSTLYQYGADGKLHAEGEHYSCVEKLGSDIDTSTGDPIDGTCLQIIVTERAEGFCWTPDPYRRNWAINDPGGFDTQGIAYGLGLLPINQNTAYISYGQTRASVLKYYPSISLESWSDYFRKQLTWAWPG